MPKKTQMTEIIYDYLKETIPKQGYAPSVREICDAVGLKSPSTVHFHLKRLQEQGRIAKGDCKGRALVLLDAEEKDRVPLVGSVAAGTPILAQECIEEYIPYACNGCEGEFFALRVRGESMLNAGILPDDIVVVHRQQTAENGQIVVALLGDEATVKRFSRSKGHVWLLPENEAYEPINGDEAQLLGKVTQVIRRY